MTNSRPLFLDRTLNLEPPPLNLLLSCCPPLVERGSALRSAPFSAPPPFELLLEASRRGACPLALPPSRAVRGPGESVLTQVQGIIPPKSDPSLT